MTSRDLWVFGYGSLMWNPEFPFEEKISANLDGYTRSFCMWSIHHRGSVEDPGLVLALDENSDGKCEGIAFRVAAEDAEETLINLRKRELISSAYYEKTCPLNLKDGRVVQAICYIIDRNHEQYCGDLSLETQAEVISKATGGRGTNTEYLLNTSAYMVDSGIDDHDIMWLVSRVNELSTG